MAAIDCNETWVVTTAKGVNVRTGPSTNNSIVMAYPTGREVKASKKDGSWIFVGSGWMCTTISSGPIMKCTATTAVAKETTKEVKQEQVIAEEKELSGIDAEKDILAFVNGGTVEPNNGDMELKSIRNVMAIHGLPYQFLPSADTRLDSKSTYVSSEINQGQPDGAALGRVYAERIIAKMPLFLITPGKPAFMKRFSKDSKQTVLDGMTKLVSGNTSALETMLNNVTETGRYYTFEFDYIRYYNFVNPMCRIAAQFLGIGESYLDGVPLKSVNWGDTEQANAFTPSRIQNFMHTGLPGCVPFYINSDTQISESFSNSTTQSMLANTVNQISDMGRELNFLLGYTSAAVGLDAFKNTDVAESVENVQEWMNGILSKNNFIESLSSNLATVAKGGKLTFPEIWSESSFSRSFDVNIKLTTPDCDPLSWYLNICVPLLHLIALVAPQTINPNPNGYMSPFLVRAMYKGLFNIEMGIITSMNITKGQDGAWTKDGLPTIVDVSFSIKDLYEAMSITNMTDSGKFDTMNNTALMDYIANLCGINIFKPEVARNIDMWLTQNYRNKITDLPFQIFGSIEQRMLNSIIGIYGNGISSR